ncbi:DUF4197 domain-containing protein [Kiloniella sp. EL199]|uniref:DUF4197 domain-containing protein n=1 Tax=Kiloniella sp. EL199 TaxID=2107581 RepID=UPI000EA1FF51|nr:DUF4197 domain-containing protein [Kiloniella sp. EL199]
MFRKFITFSAALSVTLFSLPVQADLFSEGLKVLNGGETKQKGQSQSSLSVEEISTGLKEALRVGSSRVVDKVSLQDGFNKDSNIHIPLPENLKRVQGALRTVGLSSMADDLELKLNRGAEKASVEARELFFDTISKMTLEDARRIYDGRNDEATRYFQQKMSPELKERFKPIIARTLSEVGAINSYEEVISSYKTIPFVPDVKADLTDYTASKTLEGVFYYLAKEEEQIRQNPAARTTEMLKNVFGY